MGEVKAIRVDDIDDHPDTPGAYTILNAHSTPDTPSGMEFTCPCGCGRHGYLPFRPETSPSWEWNGSEDKPTLRPSVLQVGGCRWHGWLTDGVWRSC